MNNVRLVIRVCSALLSRHGGPARQAVHQDGGIPARGLPTTDAVTVVVTLNTLVQMSSPMHIPLLTVPTVPVAAMQHEVAMELL